AHYLGRYMYGDYCHQCVWTADLEAGSPLAVRATIQDTGFFVGAGVRSISEDSAGHVYVVHSSGWVRRVDPGPGSGTDTSPAACTLPQPPPPPPGGENSGGAPAPAAVSPPTAV